MEQRKNEPITSGVRLYGGVPVLFLDGKPETGLMHWNRFPLADDVRIFRAAGIHLFSFMGVPPMRDQPDIPATYGDGLFQVPEMTHEFLDATLSMLEKEDPECRVLIRFRITPPTWWREKHPQSLIRCYKPGTKSYKTSPHASVCDPEWRAEVEKSLREMITYLESRWGHRVLGYHPGMAMCAENAHVWGNELADFSESSLRAFRRWLGERYGTIASLNRAWHTEYRSFDEAQFPDPEVYFSRNISDGAVLHDPAKNRNAIDFLDFNSEMMADAVVFQAHTVKTVLRELGRTKICAAFYGYEILPSDCLSSLCSGHMAMTRVLASQDVDMLCAPIDYSARQAGGGSLPQLLPASVELYGKLYYAEEDTRFHLTTDRIDCVSGSLPETEQILYGNFLAAWGSGGTIWWMDLFGQGWYRDPEFGRSLSFCRGFAERHQLNRESKAGIAFFISEKAAACERSTPGVISGSLVEQQLLEMTMCGAPFDLYRLEDIPELVRQDRLKQYRFAVISAAHRIDSGIRRGIEEDLKKDGRGILWLFAPGIMQEDGLSAEAVSEVTGIRLSEVPPMSFLTETRLENRRITYGLAQNLSPRLASNDPEAEILGWYVQGTMANRPGQANGGAFVRKKFPEWTSIWSGSPGVPAEWIRLFAQDSGVHVYSECGLQIFCGEDWIGASAALPGDYTITLQKPMTLLDAFSGVPILTDGTEFRVSMRRGETRIWERGSCACRI